MLYVSKQTVSTSRYFWVPFLEYPMHIVHVHVKRVGKKVFTILHSLKILFI